MTKPVSTPDPAADPRPNPLAAAVKWFERVGTSPVTARPFAEQLHRAVYGPELARLRDEATEAHTRNANLRAEVRKLEERVDEVRELNQGWARYGDRKKVERREQSDALRAALGLDDVDRTRHIPHLIERVAHLRADQDIRHRALCDALGLAAEHQDRGTDRYYSAVETVNEQRREHRREVGDLRAELVAIGAQRDDAEAERTSMIRDLHAAQFDGSTLLPDRPLDTVWEYLLDLVRKDRARLVPGSTPTIPDDAEEQIARRIADYWQGVRGVVEPDDSDYGISHHVLALIRGWGSAVANPTDRKPWAPDPSLRVSAIEGKPCDTGRLVGFEEFPSAPAAGVVDTRTPTAPPLAREHDVDVHEDTDSVRSPGWYVAECADCDWNTSGCESPVNDAVDEHKAETLALAAPPVSDVTPEAHALSSPPRQEGKK